MRVSCQGVNDHHTLLHDSPPSKKTCVRQVALDKWLPPTSVDILRAVRAGAAGRGAHRLSRLGRLGQLTSEAFVVNYVYLSVSFFILVVYNYLVVCVN